MDWEEFAQNCVSNVPCWALMKKNGWAHGDALKVVCDILNLRWMIFFVKILVITNRITWQNAGVWNWLQAVQIFHFVPVKAAAGYLAGYTVEFVDELNTFTLLCWQVVITGLFEHWRLMLPTPSGSVGRGRKKVENLEEVKIMWPVS